MPRYSPETLTCQGFLEQVGLGKPTKNWVFFAVRSYFQQPTAFHTTSIIGLVVEFVVAIDEARVRFTDDAHIFLPLVVISSVALNLLAPDVSSFCRL